VSVRGEIREEVVARDRQCMAAALDLSHTCRNKWGDPHHPSELYWLTLEHVKLRGRRIDSPFHCVAMCSQGNVQEHWSDNTENNRLANAYLLGIRVGRGGLS
jgi:hypothetical protein